MVQEFINEIKHQSRHLIRVLLLILFARDERLSKMTTVFSFTSNQPSTGHKSDFPAELVEEEPPPVHATFQALEGN
jgi:hypothetical protein